MTAQNSGPGHTSQQGAVTARMSETPCAATRRCGTPRHRPARGAIAIVNPAGVEITRQMHRREARRRPGQGGGRSGELGTIRPASAVEYPRSSDPVSRSPMSADAAACARGATNRETAAKADTIRHDATPDPLIKRRRLRGFPHVTPHWCNHSVPFYPGLSTLISHLIPRCAAAIRDVRSPTARTLRP